MLGRLLASTLLAGLVMMATGCTCMHQGMYAGPGMDACGCGTCGPAMGCDSGCGEVYWGEWTSDPPACSDPCDNCGNYVGGSGCCWPFPVLSGLRALWGYRYSPGGAVAYDGGCATCGSAPVEYMPMESAPVEMAPAPATPAPAAEEAAMVHQRPVRHATYRQGMPLRTSGRVLR